VIFAKRDLAVINLVVNIVTLLLLVSLYNEVDGMQRFLEEQKRRWMRGHQ
jgi:hypothetical protein